MKPAEALPRLTAFYDQNLKCYWILDGNKNYIQVNESSLKRHLKASGLEADTKRGEFISQVDTAINNYQLESTVSFAGPLSGYSKGVLEIGDKRILVTSEAKLIKPCKGPFPLMSSLIEQLFCDPIADQRPYVLGWLKIAVESLLAGKRRPGQALAMAGPKDCGKSFFQTIVTEILGGRIAKPYRYMSGKTTFNAELFEVEHLMIEDEVASDKLCVRREFGTRIKEFTVNKDQSCHKKNLTAINLRPFWRLSISINDEAENLMILPPIDESMLDKLILLNVHRVNMPMPTGTDDERDAFWFAIMAELPAFVYYLVHWEIPPELRCQRFGIKYYHHPGLIAKIDDFSAELRLLSIIDSVVFADASPASGPILITHESLERQLINSPMGEAARKLLYWNNACGTYLGRLAKKCPERVERNPNPQCREWILKPESVTP